MYKQNRYHHVVEVPWELREKSLLNFSIGGFLFILRFPGQNSQQELVGERPRDEHHDVPIEVHRFDRLNQFRLAPDRGVFEEVCFG